MAKTVPSKKKRNKKRSLRIQRILYTALVVIAVFVILYYLVVRPSGETSIVENTMGTILTPIQKTVTGITGFVKSWFGTSSSTEDMEATIEELKIENERLRIQIQSYAETERKLESYEVMLNAQNEYEDLSPVFAKVIAKDTGVWFDSFAINRGQNDGISVNMAVVNGDGLIGRVSEVGYNYAKVVSIVDPRSSVAALIGRTRDNGMLQGQTTSNSEKSECYMYYISNIGNIKVGDEVYTSGLDSRFPKGLYIGSVTAVSRSADSSDKYVVVQPAAEFSSIEEVFVLRQQVETIDENLAPVPTATPRPIAFTVKPTSSVSIYAVATAKVMDENAVWTRPTATPDATLVPSATPDLNDGKKAPEAIWLEK